MKKSCKNVNNFSSSCSIFSLFLCEITISTEYPNLRYRGFMVVIKIVQRNPRMIMFHAVMESISWAYSVLATAFFCRAVTTRIPRQCVRGCSVTLGTLYCLLWHRNLQGRPQLLQSITQQQGDKGISHWKKRIPTSSPKKLHHFFIKKKKFITTLFDSMITWWYQVYVRFRFEPLLQIYIVINQGRTKSYIFNP